MDQIESGTIGLPDFQREFVWTTSQVRSLLGTVFNGWPCGSILITEENNLGFKLRPVDGAPELRSPKTVLLDGQQRLTALYSAIRNSGDVVYVVDFSNFAIETAVDFVVEDNLRAIARDDWQQLEISAGAQAVRNIMPIYVLRTPSDFFEWRDGAIEETKSSTNPVDRDTLTELYKQKLSAVHRYRIPAVTLAARLDILAVSRIFEKVNRTGLRLGTFDLMVARAYDRHWNLRDEWEEARLSHPRLDDFLNGDGMPLLQAISLRAKGSVRQNDVLELGGEVRRDWARAVEATSEAIDFLVDRCGLSARGWIPYEAQLITMAAFAMDWSLSDFESDFRRWFFASSFAQQFDVAANTRISTQYRQFKDDNYAAPSVSMDAIMYASRRSQKAIWAAFLCLISMNATGDAFGRVAVSGRDEIVRALELKRVMPASLLANAGSHASWVTPPHLIVAGFALTDRGVNAQIRRLGLVSSLERAAEDVGEEAVDLGLRTQLLPPLDVLLEIGESVDAFIGARAQLVRGQLENLGLNIEDGRPEV